MEKIKQTLLPFFTLFFLLLFDGMFNAQFKQFLPFGTAEMVGRTLFIGLYIFSFRLSFRHSLILAILLGALADSYYSSILGIQIAALVIVVFMAQWIKERARLNILTLGFFGIFVYLAYSSFIYFLYSWLDFSAVSYGYFLLHQFLPSLILNAILYFILYQPLKMVMDHIKLPPMEQLKI